MPRFKVFCQVKERELLENFAKYNNGSEVIPVIAGGQTIGFSTVVEMGNPLLALRSGFNVERLED